DPEVEPRLHEVTRRPGKVLVSNDAHARLENFIAGDELAHGLAKPPDGSVRRQDKMLIRRFRSLLGTRVDLARKRLLCGAGKRTRLRARRRSVGRKHEAIQPADD